MPLAFWQFSFLKWREKAKREALDYRQILTPWNFSLRISLKTLRYVLMFRLLNFACSTKITTITHTWYIYFLLYNTVLKLYSVSTCMHKPVKAIICGSNFNLEWMCVCVCATTYPLFMCVYMSFPYNHFSHVYLICPPSLIPSAKLNWAWAEGKDTSGFTFFFSHPLNFSLCSLTRDSSVIYPRELQHSGPQSVFCFSEHSASSIIFPGRADSAQQFKASSPAGSCLRGSIGKQTLISSSSSPARGMGWAYLLHSSFG